MKTRTCIVCGAPIIMRPNERLSTYKNRTCCSRTCAGKRNRKTPQALPTRHCEHCGGALVRRASERPNKFLLRKYCDRACSEASRAYSPTRTRGRKRNDRGITFSKQDHAPMSLEALGKPREYPRVKPLGEPCPVHPSNTIGAWGKCPACVTGDNWAQRQRQVTARPNPEGGR